MAPGLFKDTQQLWDQKRESGLQVQYKTLECAYNSSIIKGLPRVLQNVVQVNFSPDTVISGNPEDHPLLRPPTPELMTVELPRRKPMQALIDRERISDAEEVETVLLGAKGRVQSAMEASAVQRTA